MLFSEWNCFDVWRKNDTFSKQALLLILNFESIPWFHHFELYFSGSIRLNQQIRPPILLKKKWIPLDVALQ
jgi:hypothetical protein